MTSPFVAPRQLAADLASATPPAVFDASLLLHPAAFDGDYRLDGKRDAWLAGHIPGSQYVDVAVDFSDIGAPLHYTHPTPQAIADRLADLGVGPKGAVVVYDSTGGLFAARLWYLLNWIGVHARVLDGGLGAWEAAGLPLETGEGSTPAAVPSWPATAAREAWVTKDELLERSATDSRPLVCGLPAGSFDGSHPSRYARRGHIPGSVNVSSRDLFAADGAVRGDGELREAYVAEGVTGDAEVLLYCGGGISAAANAITLAQLGVTAVRIYDGSLEEWAADPALPLVAGG